jgi:hypothetical protein
LITDRQVITPGLAGVGQTCRSPAGGGLPAGVVVRAAERGDEAALADEAAWADEADADGDTARPASPTIATATAAAPASGRPLRRTRMYATPIS